MDFAQIVLELWRRRGWLVVVALVAIVAGVMSGYRVSLNPPGLTPRALATGVADTQILIDTPRSALTDLGKDFGPLAARAQVFARFMTSEPVRDVIARQAGVSPDRIVTSAPLPGGSQVTRDQSQQGRQQGILAESTALRLTFQTQIDQPAISISAQAATAQDAIRLADSAAIAFTAYVADLQQRQQVPDSRRVQVRQLGTARGGLVGGELNVRLAVLSAGAVLFFGTLLVLFLSSVAASVATLRESDPPPPTTTTTTPER